MQNASHANEFLAGLRNFTSSKFFFQDRGKCQFPAGGTSYISKGEKVPVWCLCEIWNTCKHHESRSEIIFYSILLISRPIIMVWKIRQSRHQMPSKSSWFFWGPLKPNLLGPQATCWSTNTLMHAWPKSHQQIQDTKFKIQKYFWKKNYTNNNLPKKFTNMYQWYIIYDKKKVVRKWCYFFWFINGGLFFCFFDGKKLELLTIYNNNYHVFYSLHIYITKLHN